MQEIVWSQSLVLYERYRLHLTPIRGVRVATAIEYGLIAALIGLAIVTGLNQLGYVKDWFNPPAVTQPAEK